MTKYFVLLFSLLSLLAPARAQLLRPVAGENQVYLVAPGDDLYTISHAAGLGLEHVAFANAIPIRLALEPGQLPVNPPRDGLVLNIPERGMCFFRSGHSRHQADA